MRQETSIPPGANLEFAISGPRGGPADPPRDFWRLVCGGCDHELGNRKSPQSCWWKWGALSEDATDRRRNLQLGSELGVIVFVVCLLVGLHGLQEHVVYFCLNVLPSMLLIKSIT